MVKISTLMALCLDAENEKKKNNDLIIYFTIILVLFHASNIARDRPILTRSGLVTHRASPWYHLYYSGDDESFTVITGFNKETFQHLKRLLFADLPVGRKFGRPSLLRNSAKLGIFLMYMCSTMQQKYLCLIFGCIPTTVSQNLKYMRKLVCQKLFRNNSAAVQWPDNAKMVSFANMVEQREPTVKNVIGMTDGLKLKVQCSENKEEQSIYYNGMDCDTCITNILTFGPDGKIFHCVINAPGAIMA
jgi:hypothetical protein